jgi:molybdate transport system ATP-binding protein
VAIRPGEGPAVEVEIDCNGAIVLARITEQSRQTLGLRLDRKVFAVVKTVSFDRANTGAGVPSEADG